MNLRIRVTVLLVWSVLCIETGESAPGKAFVQAQQETLAQLDQYLQTADWRKRVRIRDATNEAEIIASRIYKALDLLAIGKAPREDLSILERAREEIYANPRLTLAVLKPIMFEKVGPADQARFDQMTYPPVSPDHKAAFLQICYEIAVVETNGAALSVLKELAADAAAQVREPGQRHLDLVLRENWKTAHKEYFSTKSCDSLSWLFHHILRKGKTRSEIEFFLGKAASSDGVNWEYHGTNDGRRCTVRLSYWDGILHTYDWR